MTAVNPLQQQMVELSVQMSETVSALKATEAALQNLDIERRRQQLTLSEVNGQAEDAILYKPVGKVYLMKTKDELLLDLNNAVRRNEHEFEEYQRKREILSKKRDEITSNIQELVASVRN